MSVLQKREGGGDMLFELCTAVEYIAFTARGFVSGCQAAESNGLAVTRVIGNTEVVFAQHSSLIYTLKLHLPCAGTDYNVTATPLRSKVYVSSAQGEHRVALL